MPTLCEPIQIHSIISLYILFGVSVKLQIVMGLFLTLLTSASIASSEGIAQKDLDAYPIAGFSRLCCALGMNTMEVKFGITSLIDRESLGTHNFAHLNKIEDKVGMAYSCAGGFVDVSHLRDNADWSAHVYFNIKKWLGSGKEVLARTEGGFKKRAIFFPRLKPEEINSLSDNDLEQLAISIGYNLALMHETATAFKIAVSVPSAFFANEKASAFSAEDAYSNLMGNILGVKAAKSALPYNQAMTELLEATLTELDAQPVATTEEAFELIRNDWWIRGMFSTFKHTLKRDFTYEGMVSPRLIQNAPFCAHQTPKKISIPGKLSNGLSVNDYYEIRGTMNRKLIRGVRKLGVKIEGELNQKELPGLIEVIKTKFVKELGEKILN
jgi:hypothetical protein